MYTTILAGVLVAGQQAPPLPQVPHNPYRAADYADVLRLVRSGVRVVLYVGVPNVSAGSYQVNYDVPAGFAGIRDGVYDCFLHAGEPCFRNRDGGPAFVRRATGGGTEDLTTAQLRAMDQNNWLDPVTGEHSPVRTWGVRPGCGPLGCPAVR